VVWDGVGVGVGAGGLDDGVGFGVGGAEVGPDAGAVEEWVVDGAELLAPWLAGCVAAWLALLPLLALWLAVGDVLAALLLEVLRAGVFVDVEAVVVEAAAWLNRFAPPATPTTLSSVARQVSLDSLRRLASRRAPICSRCRMAPRDRTGR
jgi:hypothetical protein